MDQVMLTPDQLDAVDVSKRHLDACVVAGPGSGKTTVLVEYFRRLVEAGGDPLRILAITFTEKAAGNMRSKLAEAFQENAPIRARLERAWVSTVHGFCARLLRENAVTAGIDPEFYVADERESWRLQRESIAAAMDGLLAEHPAAMRALIRGLPAFDFEEAVLSAYDAMRGAGVSVQDLAAFPAPAGTRVRAVAETLAALRREGTSTWNHMQREQLESAIKDAERIVAAGGPAEALQAAESLQCNLNKCKKGNTAYNLLKRMKDQIEEAKYALITELYAAERETLLEILRRFDRSYRERKRQAGALDFADLEEFTVRLLREHAETQARVRNQFDHILMDEFQDTNGQQAKLMQLVRPRDRFYAVGDINQSIFGFRHAEPEGFAKYLEEVARGGGHIVELMDNFRSRDEILSAVETITHDAPGISERRLVARRRFERLRAVCVDLLSAADIRTEGRWVARRIVELVEDEGFHFGEIAVLVRNTEVIADFTTAFDEAGLPYLVNRGRGFYEAREVNDLTHLLRTIANPRDEISLAAVLRSPLVAVSDEALLGLKVMGENLGGSLKRLGPETAAVFDEGDCERLRRFRDQLREWRMRREYVSFDRLLLEAIDDCGYETDARGAGNIDKFLAQARAAAGRMSLDAFVEELALVRASNPREPDAPPEDGVDAVKVMTMHSAKGLEFPVVFVAALHKGVETSPPVVAFSRRYGLGARWRNPGGGKEKDDLFQHALREERKVREEEESNRLLYVAMTRAEQHLVLSFSGKKPANWAKDVVGRLGVDVAEPRDEVVTQVAPDGKEWRLRVAVADRAPEVRVASAATATAPAGPERSFVASPAVTDQRDSNATVTALAKFASCPREYFLGHYLGFEGRLRKLEEPEDGELSAGDFGTQVHALLAGGPVAKADAEAVRLAEVFRQSQLGRRVARASRLEREFDFLMAVEDLVVTGQVDLWFEEGGELVIVDYKTDAVSAVEAHQRAQDYGLQLRLYSMAVERVAGRPVDQAWLHFLRPNTMIEVDVRPSLLDSPEQIVREFQEAQSKREFPLREGERCLRCPFYRDLCPAGEQKAGRS
ncbi:MAG TPA: UvrD-helicase domain-containing protein [Bryobacteraceae bacterium]|nr:UvrD-helicase domain-containing protein [Bryobacteraceae bacterium]